MKNKIIDIKINSPISRVKDRPLLITGPCSAETEKQMMQTAEMLANNNVKVDLFRAGIWKPRTRPGAFEGVGIPGLKWLKKVKENFGFKTTTEVANTQHIFEAIKADVDVLWIGARTTVNPFSMQEISNALRGTDIPIFIKNPINPDQNLWKGAIERIYNAGITKIGLIHRGFSRFGDKEYRNEPLWQIPLELKREFPGIMMICDSSHICGSREKLFEVSQTALDLNFDGLMLESHCNPKKAWSDAKQQVKPKEMNNSILSNLKLRNTETKNKHILENIEYLRSQIDTIDNNLIQMMGNRMKIAKKIGIYKKENNITVYQANRWNEIVEKTLKKAIPFDLSEEFVSQLLKAIHQESINHQETIMLKK